MGFGSGIGWYAQQSLELTLDEARELARILNELPASEADAAPLPLPVDLNAYRARRMQPGT